MSIPIVWAAMASHEHARVHYIHYIRHTMSAPTVTEMHGAILRDYNKAPSFKAPPLRYVGAARWV